MTGNKRRGWNFLSTGVVSVVGLFAVFLGNYQRVGDWAQVPFIAHFKAAHFLMSYQSFGFVKRGLPGTLLELVSPAFGIDLITFVGVLMGVAAVAVVAGLCFVKRCSLGAALAIALSPFTFQNLGFDLGRQDHIGLIFTAGIVVFAERQGAELKRQFYLLAGAAMGAALLSHEVAAFFVPALVVYLWEKDRSLRKLVLFVLPVLLALACLGLWGQYEGETEALNRHFREAGLEKAPGEVWTRDVQENVRKCVSVYRNPKIAEASVLVSVVLLGAWFFACGQLLETRISGLLLLMCLAPVGLFLLGADAARWFALSGMLGTIMMLAKAGPSSGLGAGLGDTAGNTWRVWLSGLIALCLALSGAAGILGQVLMSGEPVIGLLYQMIL